MDVKEIQSNFKMLLDYPQPYTSYPTTLNNILISINFSLQRDENQTLIRTKVYGLVNVIKNNDPEAKILSLKTKPK